MMLSRRGWIKAILSSCIGGAFALEEEAMAQSNSSSTFALPPLPELRETRVFGQRICYYDIGKGVPLVLVHGVGGDADQWAFCFDALSASHRVVALDLPGFGRSAKPMMEYRI